MNVLVIDMLEGFTRKGPLANPRIARLLPKQAAFLNAIPPSYVLFACDMHDPSDPEFARFPVHCLKGTEEANICPELIEACNERDHVFTVVHKHTPSAFFKTLVEPKIPAELKDWVVFGCTTDICIAANVMELSYRDKDIVVLRDLTDTFDSSHHDAEALNSMFFDCVFPEVWGVRVATSAEFLKEHGP